MEQDRADIPAPVQGIRVPEPRTERRAAQGDDEEEEEEEEQELTLIQSSKRQRTETPVQYTQLDARTLPEAVRQFETPVVREEVPAAAGGQENSQEVRRGPGSQPEEKARKEQEALDKRREKAMRGLPRRRTSKVRPTQDWGAPDTRHAKPLYVSHF